ncbi:ORF6N domain-containing protein [Candidatus Saccharibacteria bacterium]|nr:ORF6N domain-containing protein [Candidatus Saccharibacteria bacterium]
MDKNLEKGGEIENLIYEIRGKQVMLDSDLARLYECKNGTKVINQAVRRNTERFPQDFYFQLTTDELLYLRSQFVTAKSENMSRTLPYVFTEQGVAMLATVIRTEVAAQMSVAIMRAFVAMRKYFSDNLLEQKYINDLVLEDHEKIELLENSFQNFEEKKKVNEIYFKGQIYDAYAKILEIFNEAKIDLVIVDAYADKTLLDIIKRLRIDVTIIAKPDNFLTEQDVKRYNAQYNNLKVIYDDTFHDRYFILDNESVYHCGASINRIGWKTFSINRIEDEDVCRALIKKIDLLSG